METSRIPLLLLLTFLSLSVCQSVLFRVPSDAPVELQGSTRLYIAYMGQAAAADATIITRQLQADVLSQVLGSPSAAEESLVYNYVNGFSGFAAMLSSAHAEQLRGMPGVISVYVAGSVKVQTTSSYSYLGLTTTAGVWPETSFGANSIVGIMDTGVWPESASFDDSGMSAIPSRWKGECVTAPGFSPANCNKKLIGAKFFVKGYEATYGPVAGSGVSRSPRDTEGHGTHTASTATGRRVPNASMLELGKGTATGGAPASRLSVYKVCWEFDCNSADILAAFDEAIKDGVDILSLSLGGSPSDYQEDSIAIGSFHAVAKGILVAASGGNSGPFLGSVSNIAPWLLTVAASSINREFLAKVLLGNGESYDGVTINTFTMKAGTMLPLVSGGDIPAVGFTSEEASFCLQDSLDKMAAKGKVIVCNIGGGATDSNVFEAGGAGLIVITEEYKSIGFIWSIPTSSVSEADGDLILAYINSTSSPTVRIEKSATVFNENPAPVAAIFSSRGPNIITSDILKPDITAPGVDILAAWSPEASLTGSEIDNRKVDFSIISGTSMSCPHVTGIAALLKSLHPEWSPAAIKSAMMTTATPLDSSINEGAVELAGGSGQVDPTAASDPGLVFDITSKEYALFLCSIGYSTEELQLVTGDTSACPKVPPTVLDLNYPSIFSTSNGTTSVTRVVTNVGPALSTYKVSVVQPEGVRVSVTPSVLSFSARETKQSFTVTIQPTNPPAEFPFGSITWSDGVRQVRIPVGVSRPFLS